MVLEDLQRSVKDLLVGNGKEEKPQTVRAEFLIRRDKPLSTQAQERLRAERISEDKVLMVGDTLLIVIPKKGTARLVLGRGQRTDIDVSWTESRNILVQNQNVSRQHAAVDVDFAHVEAVDLGSRHGLRYQGRRPERTRSLALDDEFQLAQGPILRYLGREPLTLKGGDQVGARKIVRIR